MNLGMAKESMGNPGSDDAETQIHRQQRPRIQHVFFYCDSTTTETSDYCNFLFLFLSFRVLVGDFCFGSVPISQLYSPRSTKTALINVIYMSISLANCHETVNIVGSTIVKGNHADC